MRPAALRITAVLFALTWLIVPGFGLVDLSVTWDPGWPVVLEAGWAIFMTVLVAGSLVAVAVRPARSAPALATLGVALLTLLASAALGLEWQVLGYAALLAVEGAVLVALGAGRERLRPIRWSPWPPLLLVAVAGAGPWVVHAGSLFRANRRDAGEIIGELTNGVDHHAVQGALALALAVLPLLAACWPRGRQHLGISAGLAAAYLGLVSYAFPGTWAGLSPTWSVLCIGWGVAAAGLAAAAPRLQPGQLRGEVVEAERAL